MLSFKNIFACCADLVTMKTYLILVGFYFASITVYPQTAGPSQISRIDGHLDPMQSWESATTVLNWLTVLRIYS